MIEEPIFPIIGILKGDNIIYSCTNIIDYLKCDITYLDKFKDSIVIDSTGTYFKIEKTERTGWGTWMWGYHPLMKGRSIKIRFTYSEIRKLDWVEFKEIIADKLTRDVDSTWYANDPKIILKQLEKPDSFKRVIELFAYDES